MSAVPPLKILKASAGSGKTFSLTAHYLTLLFSGEAKYREILAITFTNKATAEMKTRILGVLQALAVGDPEGKAAGYRQLLLQAYPKWGPADLQQRAADIYRRILHDYGRFAVTTIDGFTQKVIRGFTFELGIDAGYKLELNIRKVKADLVLRLNRMLDDRSDLLQWIIDYAEARIARDEHWNYRSTLNTLASEIFKEDFQDFDKAVSAMPEQELFASLDAFCKETIQRFENAFGQLFEEAVTAFAASGVTAEDLVGKSRNQLAKLASLREKDYKTIVEKLQKYIDAPDNWQKGGPSGPVADLYRTLNPLLGQLSHLYAEQGPDYYLAKAIDENLYYLRLLKEMSTLLGEWRRDNGAQLISDAQILLNNIGLNESGDPTFIWEKTGNRFRHFLFDEFQDTSRRQWDNLRPLLINAMGNASGRRSEHLIVGDVKQSIYRWRNGDWRILLDRAEQQIGQAFHTDDTTALIENDTLDVNYRSHEAIVRFNNALFAEAPGWLQSRLNARIREELGENEYRAWWEASGYNDTIVRAYRDSRQRLPESLSRSGGCVQVEFIEVSSDEDDDRTTKNTAGQAVKAEALARMANALFDWLSSGTYRPGQIGILVRTNREARETIQFILERQRETGITFDIISGDALALSGHPAVRLLIDTLRALAGKQPEAALYVANCVYLYSQLSARTTPLGDDDWLKIDSGNPETWIGMLPDALCHNWSEWARLPLADLIELLIEAYGLHVNAPSLPYLFAFRDLVAAFTVNGERGIPAFLTYWEEEGVERALPPTGEAQAVEVLTIHKSKGLAFDVVMIPFCSWSIDGFPNGDFWVSTEGTPYALLHKTPVKYKSDLGRSRLYRAYYEEMLFNYMDALNTLYVATTRARQHLYITAPKTGDVLKDRSLVAGDLIGKNLSAIADQLTVPDEGRLELGSPVPDNGSGANVSSDATWAFDGYPLSTRIKDEPARPATDAELDLIRLDRAKRQGQLLHEVLAEATTADGLESCVNTLQAAGRLRADEREEILTLATRTWHHPRLAAWLNGNYTHWNERSIILPDGRTLRPDKVLIGRDETIVLDFKFTQQEQEAHLRQVISYLLTLQEMGMPNVRGYVYYGMLDKIVEV